MVTDLAPLIVSPVLKDDAATVAFTVPVIVEAVVVVGVSMPVVSVQYPSSKSLICKVIISLQFINDDITT